jgi:hypothetical protein
MALRLLVLKMALVLLLMAFAAGQEVRVKYEFSSAEDSRNKEQPN